MFDEIARYFSQKDFMPHGHCYLWKPGLVVTHVVSDALIGVAYFSISVILYVLVRKIKIQFDQIVLSFGVFIGACGLTHFLEIWNLWNADYWFSGWVKALTALASVTTGIYLYKLRRPIVQVAEAAKLAEQRRLDLENLTIDLEKRVTERTAELNATLAARDRFLELASHELKTPLTTLKIQTQLHLKKIFSENAGLDFEKSEKYLSIVETQYKKLEKLVNDMLDVSTMHAGKLELHFKMIKICELLEGVVEEFTLNDEGVNGKIMLELCEEVPVYLDEGRFRQSVSNIISNALKYAPHSPIIIRASHNEKEIHISISDQGKGIHPEKLKKIFERFERAASETDPSGLGLGLYIARQVMLGHGGDLWVDSSFGHGSTFHIMLPMKRKPNAPGKNSSEV